MSKKLFVASLPWAFVDQKLGDFFSKAGRVLSAQVMKDRLTGKSRGFGFVEMETEEALQEALKLNQADCDGRKLVVNIAKPKEYSTGGNR